MAIVSLSASASGLGNLRSAYGTPAWGPTSSDGSSIGAAGIAPGGGAGYAVWHVQASVPPNESFNVIKMQGYVIFNVSFAGTRKATLRCNALRDYDAFEGAGGTALGSHAGNAQQNGINYNYAPQGFTSNDVLNGFFFGITVSTEATQLELGPGSYNYGALDWTIYTGPDAAAPTPDKIQCRFTNPKSNYKPGKFAGSQFTELTCTLEQPTPEADYDNKFSLPSGSGLTFANGTRNLSVRKGYNLGSNPDTYVAHTGLINISPTTAPGTYVITVVVENVGTGSSGYQSQTLTSNLVVRPMGGMLTET